MKHQHDHETRAEGGYRLSVNCFRCSVGVDGKTFVMRAGAKLEQMAVNELSGVERVYGVAAVDRALLLRSGRKLIKLSER